MRLKGNCIIGQAGGATAVINNSLYGIMKEAKVFQEIQGIYGSLYGIEGVIKRELIDLKKENVSTIGGLKFTPGAILGGSRYKLDYKRKEDFKKIFSTFKSYNIRYFFYIGGNDSMDTAAKVDVTAKKIGYKIRVIGVPKTIDNDLIGTHHSPGFGSCAKYIAATVQETGRHTESMRTSEPITILETVGRNTGWVAGSSALAKECEEDAPHIICFPEIVFSRKKFTRNVKRIYEKFGSVFIVTGEGLKDENDQYITCQKGSLDRDAFGHPQLGGIAETLKKFIEEDIGIKTRYIKPAIAQQAAMHFASFVDAQESMLVGSKAVKYAIEGKSGFMVTLEKERASQYKCKTSLVKLTQVCNKERRVPRSWINREGNFPAKKFLDYARPLIQGEVKVPIKDGLPQYVRLKKVFV
ncbi:MAG: 6-phosphofructokinase [Parcubacteria group bacterium CG23_combo_of_CG06-09_8_20_14_all_35_9]|nr:MAG: 6-phosphofructokinase [Parcubacteria group bacterium CG23_combo_of_CG06-09_8_20_14_all_35_9]